MEFGLFLQGHVPNKRVAENPDYEHVSFMNDVALAKEADRSGFKYVWVSEHHFLDEYSHLSASETFLAYLAGQTERIHLGSAIWNISPPVNPPVRGARDDAAHRDLQEGDRRGRADRRLRQRQRHDHELGDLHGRRAQGARGCLADGQRSPAVAGVPLPRHVPEAARRSRLAENAPRPEPRAGREAHQGRVSAVRRPRRGLRAGEEVRIDGRRPDRVRDAGRHAGRSGARVDQPVREARAAEARQGPDAPLVADARRGAGQSVATRSAKTTAALTRVSHSDTRITFSSG